MRDPLDTALDALAQAVARAEPRPGALLSARVLADAERVLAERRPDADRAPHPGATVVPLRPGRRAVPGRAAPGWLAQAAVAMAACLLLGFAAGYALDAPVLDLADPGPLAAVDLAEALFSIDEAI